MMICKGGEWWAVCQPGKNGIHYRAAVKRRNKARADLRYQSRYTTTYHPGKDLR